MLAQPSISRTHSPPLTAVITRSAVSHVQAHVLEKKFSALQTILQPSVPVYMSLLIVIRPNVRDFVSDQNNLNFRHMFFWPMYSTWRLHCCTHLPSTKINFLPLQAVRNSPSTSILSKLTYHYFLKRTNEEVMKKSRQMTEHRDLMFWQMLRCCHCKHEHCYIT